MRSIALLAVLMPVATLPAQDKAPRLDVKVLYAGVESSPRTAEWKKFLTGTFAEVTTVELASLSLASARNFDVVIVDSPTPYKRPRGFQMPKAPQLGEDYSKPTILMGAAGGATIRRGKQKLGWL